MIREDPIAAPAAWHGADLQDSDEWIVRFTEGDLHQIERALAGVRERRPEEIGAEDFPLPDLDDRLRGVADELHRGRGFALLRGLPVGDRFDDEEAAKIYWAFGLRLGTPVSQNRRGEMLGHLRNIATPGAFERRYATNEATAFHSDRTDLVGLMCLRRARFGGESLLCSTMDAYNIVLREHPEYLPVLYKYFPKDLMGDHRPGEPGWELLPLFCYEEGWLSGTTSTGWLVSAMRFEDVPRLSALEMSCFLFLESLVKRPGRALSMLMEPGDIQFVNNFTVTHTRTGFVDDPDDPTLQRHLLRLWLSNFDGGRPICAALANNRIGIAPLEDATA